MTKDEILTKLKQENVNNLDDLADMLVKKAHQDGDPNKPLVNSAIIYKHGFVTS